MYAQMEGGCCERPGADVQQRFEEWRSHNSARGYSSTALASFAAGTLQMKGVNGDLQLARHMQQRLEERRLRVIPVIRM